MTTMVTPATAGAFGATELAALRKRLRGAALLPGEMGYDEARAAWNRNARQQPAVVVVAEDADDIRAAVGFARDEGCGVGVMATGHGAGAPCDGGVLVNTARMRGVRIDPVRQTATVEAGALWKDVIAAAAPHGLAGLAGSAPYVGVVGYTMGGGFGWLGRKYGLNADGVTAAEIVTADGEIVRLSATETPDLFWGLNGGGGNFGIVTSLEFRLYPLTTVYGGAVFYPADAAPEVLGRYAEWSAALPNEVTSAFVFLNLPPLPAVPKPLQGRPVIAIRGCFCGQIPADGEVIFRPIREGLGAPLMDTYGELPVAAMETISKDPVDPVGILQRADLLTDLSPQTIAALIGVAGAGSGSPLTIVELRQLGGALARSAERLSPIGSGDARYSLNAIGLTLNPEMAAGIAAHMDRLIAAMRPFRTGETCLNYLELAPTTDRIRAAYPAADWDRLAALKTTYDPENRFRFNRNIPPSRGGGEGW